MTIKLKLTRKENCDHYKVSAGQVVSLDLDMEYLPVCVASEVYESNTRTPIEAKKAQAVASRSYALSFVAKGVVMDDTTSYQAFSWKDLSKIPNSAKAVSETAGEVLVNQGKIITAWYSSSNGGQTKRSDQAWKASTPWTVCQEDPWDTAGRAKWNITKIMHGVGMSQTGAAYAGTIGVSYEDILAFYYPNTVITSNFGEGAGTEAAEKPKDSNDPQITTPSTPPKETEQTPESKTNTGLVAFARSWVGQVYWYGTCCYPCTNALLKTKSAQYPSMYTASRMPRYQKDIQGGKSCADCVGLIKGYHWWKNGKVIYDKSSDVTAGGLYKLANIKGPIQTIPEVPGVVVYKPGHIGIYEGNGNVIEAKGFAYGIIRSKIGDTPWTNWAADPFISYDGYQDALRSNDKEMPYTAVAVTKVTPLNIWKDTSMAKSLLQVQKGDSLTVTGYANKDGWYTVEKDGVVGVANGQYLL